MPLKLRRPVRPVAGSERAVAPGARLYGDIDPHDIVELTVRLRARQAITDEDVARLAETPLGEREYLSYEAMTERHGADDADIERVTRFAHDHDVEVVDTSRAKRTVVLRGRASVLQRAFGNVDLKLFLAPTGAYRGRVGALHVPEDLAEIIEGVFGFDNRMQAKPHYVVRAPGPITARAATAAFTPPEVANLYGFPKGDGAGECIGILEFGGGYGNADLTAYFGSLGMAVPNITSVSAGLANTPGVDVTADGEVLLDIEVAASVAPAAKIVVYFAPFTERGWIDILSAAVHDTQHRPSVLSISWGWAEGFDIWTKQAVQAVNDLLRQAAMLGITVCVASGDDGSADDVADGRVHVDFPAASPYVLACGGTTVASAGGVLMAEKAWNNGPRANQGGGATGGGVSVMFPLPAWQKAAGVPLSLATGHAGRGVPDVAGDADPNTGYRILFDGFGETMGGTSAVAPLWAALVARLNQTFGKRCGFLNPLLYSGAGRGFHDIVVGTNDTTGHYGGYRTRRGWDACTGLGSPNGAELVALLQPSSTAPHTGTPSVRPPEEPTEPRITWQPLPGAATDLGVTGHGTLWAVAPDAQIYRWTGGGWCAYGGQASRIAVAPDASAWVVTTLGAVVHSNGPSWETLGDGAADISVAPDGTVWVAGSDGSLRRCRGGSDWQVVGEDAARVAAVRDGVWVVRRNGDVAYWNGEAFEPQDIQAIDVGAGGDAVWIASPAYELLRRGSDGWVPVDGYAIAVSVDGSGMPWVVAPSMAIFAAS